MWDHILFSDMNCISQSKKTFSQHTYIYWKDNCIQFTSNKRSCSLLGAWPFSLIISIHISKHVRLFLYKCVGGETEPRTSSAGVNGLNYLSYKPPAKLANVVHFFVRPHDRYFQPNNYILISKTDGNHPIMRQRNTNI